MHHERVHSVFWYIGRASIIIPCVLIALALIFKIDTERSKPRPTTPIATLPTPSPTPVNFLPLAVPGGTSIDLQSPKRCVLTGESNDTGTVYISNQKIYAEYTHAKTGAVSKILIRDDCLYKWRKYSVVGEQICGVSGYLGLLNTMSKFGIINTDSFISIITQFTGDANQAEALAELTPVCAAEPVADTIFAVDPGVTFKKQNIPSPTPK